MGVIGSGSSIITNPAISIGPVFQVMKHTSWIPKGYKIGDNVVEDYLGGLHVNALYRKEQFSLVFFNLDEYISDTLEQLIVGPSSVGVNVFHTVQVTSPKMLRIWDGSTSPSVGINSDINRVRNQVYITNYLKNRIPGNMNRYKVTVECQET